MHAWYIRLKKTQHLEVRGRVRILGLPAVGSEIRIWSSQLQCWHVAIEMEGINLCTRSAEIRGYHIIVILILLSKVLCLQVLHVCVNHVSNDNWWLACAWFGTVGIADISRNVVPYFGDEENFQKTTSTFRELSLFPEQEALRFVRTIDVVLHFCLPRDDTSGCYPSPSTAIVFHSHSHSSLYTTHLP